MHELIDAWNTGNNKLGLKVLTLFDDNVAFSPLSTERSMGMLIDGARNNTYEELTKGLEMPRVKSVGQLGKVVMGKISQAPNIADYSMDNHHKWQKEFMFQQNYLNPVKMHYDSTPDHLNFKTDSDISDNLKSAVFFSDNRLWVQKEFNLLQNYSDAIEKNYGAAPTYLDFKNHPEEAAKSINESVEKATKGHIKELYNKSDFAENTKLILTNTMYFKSSWINKYKFNEHSTKKQMFYAKNDSFMVDMMHSSALSANDVFLNEEWIAVTMPFEDGFLYTAVLPVLKEGETTETALRRVKELFYQEYANNVFLNINKNRLKRKYKIDLSMPKFEFNVTIGLKDVLKKLGITTIWDAEEAQKGHTVIDFSGMNGYSSKTATEKDGFLYPDDAVQKVFLKIDEKGGEAAVATASITLLSTGRFTPVPLNIVFDHPYFYMISKEQTILFIGQVMDPRKSEITLNVHSDKIAENSVANPTNYPAHFYTNLSKLNTYNSNTVYTITRSDILRYVRKNNEQIRVCYTNELKRTPKLSGTLMTEWSISKQGTINNVRIKESSLHNDNLENCVINTIKTWKFPENLTGEVTVQYPFSFQTGRN